jgi:hypothetical protein
VRCTRELYIHLYRPGRIGVWRASVGIGGAGILSVQTYNLLDRLVLVNGDQDIADDQVADRSQYQACEAYQAQTGIHGQQSHQRINADLVADDLWLDDLADYQYNEVQYQCGYTHPDITRQKGIYRPRDQHASGSQHGKGVDERNQERQQ